MTGPIDTIREALEAQVFGSVYRNEVLAALTEVEHQLAALSEAQQFPVETVFAWKNRAVAAEAALAEKDTECADWYGKALAAQHDQERAETALADYENGKRIVLHEDWRERCEAAEQRANDQLKIAQNTYELLVQAKRERNELADALRTIASNERWVQAGPLVDAARAALDRHTPTATDEQIDRSFDAYR